MNTVDRILPFIWIIMVRESSGCIYCNISPDPEMKYPEEAYRSLTEDESDGPRGFREKGSSNYAVLKCKEEVWHFRNENVMGDI